MTVKIEFDQDKLEQRLKDSASVAQKKLDAKVLNDSNFFCPQDTGVLQKSGIAHTVIGSGAVIWQTPYARKQYYGEELDHSKNRNPNATAKWFETAKAKFLGTWLKIVKGEF